MSGPMSERKGEPKNRPIAWSETFDRLRAALYDDKGVFLVARDEQGRPHPMTISWAQIGVVWNLPIFTVFVRESRYTHRCLMSADSFTINVPAPGELKDELLFCGTKSGRDLDKVEACGLTTVPGRQVSVPYLESCPLHYECQIVAVKQLQASDVVSHDILGTHYPSGDPHLIVLGEIVGTYGESATEANDSA